MAKLMGNGSSEYCLSDTIHGKFPNFILGTCFSIDNPTPGGAIEKLSTQEWDRAVREAAF